MSLGASQVENREVVQLGRLPTRHRELSLKGGGLCHARLRYCRARAKPLFQPHVHIAKLNTSIKANMALGRLSPLLNRIRRHRPIIKHTSFVFYSFITWLPALIWMNSKVGEVAWIQGGSMYPYLNTDIDRSTKQDACWNNKWKPLEGLRRGMIVTFWFDMPQV
jgi:hypothetical protein